MADDTATPGAPLGPTVRTTCPYCGVGCGVIARSLPSGQIEIAGDAAHPANRGLLCSKGAALAQTIGLEGRLLYPLVRGARVSWDAALDHVAREFGRIVAEHGPQALALYVSGQLLTEDYYVANKLMKGYVGTANIDTNSRLCMASAVAGHKRAFGEDLVPLCYDDLAVADLLVLVGSNAAWCHPVLLQRMMRAKESRPAMRIVVVDPRRTATCEFADLHLPVAAGTDVWLFNALLAHLDARGATGTEFVRSRTNGAEEALAVARRTSESLQTVAATCGVDARALAQFFDWFAATERVVTMFSQGVNQSSVGTDKVNAIINCHLLTGRIGRPGMGPFSVTGQPNAMGGREVGGMSSMLAGHMELERADHRSTVQRFWGSPRIADRPGLKAVELFDAIHDGAVKAVWIMGTNPVVSMPDADKVAAALRRCELVVVSDCVAVTDTTQFAHVLLPAAAWGEKDGTVTNSDRTISRQRAFLPAPGEAQPDWSIVAAVARRMGFTGFDFASARDVFVEHAALTGADNGGTRVFDISGLAALDAAAYADFEPKQWPIPVAGHPGTARLFEHARFSHPDSRARLVATPPQRPGHAVDREFPLVLNTGRVRDQWHTMTRSGRSPRLTAHMPEPFADLHARNASEAGIRAGDLVRVSTRWGSLIARARVSDELQPGCIFIPMHWNDQFASAARVGALVNPVVDAVSGEPEFKHTPARIEPFHVAWHGFLLSRRELESLPATTWWNRSRCDACWRYEIAGDGERAPAAQSLRDACAPDAVAIDWLEYRDPGAGAYRAALVRDDRLEACLFIAPGPDLPERFWLISLFARRRLGDAERASLLLGRTRGSPTDAGPVVCSCFGIGRRTIADSVARYGLQTPQEVGQRLRAGTNCGSCLAEIRKVIAESRAERE